MFESFMSFQAAHWILSKEPECTPSLIPSVEELMTCEGYVNSDNQLKWLQAKLKVQDETIPKVLVV